MRKGDLEETQGKSDSVSLGKESWREQFLSMHPMESQLLQAGWPLYIPVSQDPVRALWPQLSATALRLCWD